MLREGKWARRKPFTGDGLWRAFAAARDAAIEAKELAEPFTLHDIRAKSSSDTDSVEAASARLGHASTTTTERVYRRKAKALAEHAAKLETERAAKRVTIANLHERRVAFVDELMKNAAGIVNSFALPVSMREAPEGAGPELLYLKRYGDIDRALDAATQALSASSHLVTTEFLDRAFAWLHEARTVLGK